MSKRKRASLGKTPTSADLPAGEETTAAADDVAVKEDMVHVNRDVLAGSPDIFAPKWNAEEPATAAAPEVVTEPVIPEAPPESIEPHTVMPARTSRLIWTM